MEKEEMFDKLKSELENYSTNFQRIYDPVQNYAIQGVNKYNLDKVKTILRKNGAKKVRTINSEIKGIKIVAFYY